VKDENGDLLTDSQNILNRLKGYFSLLMNVHKSSAVRQIQVYTAEQLVPSPSRLEVEIAIAKLKKYKSQGSDEIPELIQAGGKILLSAIHKLIPFGIRKNCLISGRSLLLYQFTKRVTKLAVIIIVGYHCSQLHTKFFEYPLLKVKSIHRENYWGSSVCFDVTDQLLIRFSAVVRYNSYS
jgi:hypothetical protein